MKTKYQILGWSCVISATCAAGSAFAMWRFMDRHPSRNNLTVDDQPIAQQKLNVTLQNYYKIVRNYAENNEVAAIDSRGILSVFATQAEDAHYTLHDASQVIYVSSSLRNWRQISKGMAPSSIAIIHLTRFDGNLTTFSTISFDGQILTINQHLQSESTEYVGIQYNNKKFESIGTITFNTK